MMAMIANEGYYLSDENSGSGDYDDPFDFFDFIMNRSTALTSKPNDDGYGIMFYPEEGSFYFNEADLYDINNQAWYKTSKDNNGVWHYPTYPTPGWTYYGDPNHTWMADEPLDIAEDAIMNSTTQASIVLGHARQGTGGQGNHPFRLDWNGQTYTFMHNGAIDSTFKTKLRLYLQNLDIGTSNWFDIHPTNWLATPQTEADESNFIDSELFFHYLMSYIINANGDVIQGLYNAINEDNLVYNANGNIYNVQQSLQNTSGSYSANFILSDGENIYAFRNDDIGDLNHSLGFYENDNFIGIRSYGSGSAGYKELAVNELVVLSPTGHSDETQQFISNRMLGFLKEETSDPEYLFLNGEITTDIDKPCALPYAAVWVTGNITINTDITVTPNTNIVFACNAAVDINSKITLSGASGFHLSNSSTVNINSGGELLLDWGSTITGAVGSTVVNGTEIPGDRIIAQNGGKITTHDESYYLQNPGAPITISSSSGELWDGIFIDTPDNAENIWFVNCDISGINNFSLETISSSARTRAYLNFYYTDFQDCGSLTVKNRHHLNFMGESATTKSQFKNNTGSLNIYQSTFNMQYVNFEKNEAPVYFYDCSPIFPNDITITDCDFYDNTREGLRINVVDFEEFSNNTITDNNLYGMLCFNGTNFKINNFNDITINNNESTEYLGWPGTFRMEDPSANINISDSNYSGGSDNYLLCNIAWDGSTPVNIQGTNINSVDHLFPINTAAWTYNPLISVPKDLLDLAKIDYANENYADAQVSLYQLLDDYLTCPEAVEAVYYLYHIEVITQPTCDDLRTYLNSIKVNASSYLYNVIQQVYAKTLIKDKDYIQAIDVLEDIIITTTFPDEALVAMIDQGFAYLNLPEGRATEVSNCTMKPKSFADYEAKVADLNRQFSFYPTEEEQQQDGIVSAKLSSAMNYPNPFNPTTTISYNLAADSQVELTVYNVKGQKVKTLVNKPQQAGTRSVIWNGQDDQNKAVSSGIYFYKIKTDADVKMSRMILLK